MKPRTTLLFAACLATLAWRPVEAFDGKHQGFLLGVGLGPGVTSYKIKDHVATGFFVDSSGVVTLVWRKPSDRNARPTVTTDFRIGFGASERWLIYYDNRVSWFGVEGQTVTNGLTQAAASYYFHSRLSVTAGVGVDAWNLPFATGSTPRLAVGFMAGGGWEFGEHWMLEPTVMYGRPSDHGRQVVIDALSVTVTLAHVWY